MSAQSQSTDFDTEAQDVHDRILVLDAHVDILLPETPRIFAAADGGSHWW